MGCFFTSICAQAPKTTVKNALRSIMKSRGWRVDNKNSELRFEIVPGGSKWCCLNGNLTDLEDCEGFVNAFASELAVPVLFASCRDSDYIYLQLHRDGGQDTACIGTPYDEEKPIPSREFWQGVVKNFDAFNDLLSNDWVFAEEALQPLGELMGFDGNTLLPFDEANEKAVCIGFSRTAAKGSPLVLSGPTILNHQRRQFPSPYNLHTNSIVVMHNYGGPSRGIEIMIELAFPGNKRCEYEIYDTHIRTGAQQLKQAKIENYSPVKLERVDLRDGVDRWHAILPDFEIPEGLNLDYEYSSPFSSQQQMTEFQQSIIFNYRLRIPEYLESLNIHFTPLENPEGSYTWRLEDCYHTPQEMKVFHREGVDAFREIIRQKREAGKMPFFPVDK